MSDSQAKTIDVVANSASDVSELIGTLTLRIDDIERRTHRIEENVEARLTELIETFGVISDAMVFLSGSVEHLRVSMARKEGGDEYRWRQSGE